ncbi:hypothetical protein [Comamonas sp.]|uniref:hypothetical protein n=1 Tax=Comamonas sp. TaxID=34028 RepID=UPI0028AACD23|nr:hypothetical protein [Comamonas sp.]
MDRPTTPAPNIIELALQYGASSYRNRSDTAHPAYGFTERGLLQFAESLVARARPQIAALHTIAQYPATESLLNMDAANMRKIATDAVAGLKSDRTEHHVATITDDADNALIDVIKERDDAEEFGDKLLDLVLGSDRPEWSSAYGTDDALLQVEEKMAALERAQAGTSSTLASDIPGAGAAALDAYLTICRTNAIVPDVGGAWASAFRAGADYATQAMATQAGPATWDLIEQLVQLECSRQRLHLEYMGKAMPADVYLRFQKLRDERIPALQSQLRAALAATPKPPATEDSSAGDLAEVVHASTYVQPVPDHCDRIVWRGQYIHLPIAQAKVQAEPVMFINPKVIDKSTGKIAPGAGALTHAGSKHGGWTFPVYAAPQAKPADALEHVCQAIRDYHYALDTRQHGGVAAHAAVDAIETALGMPWHQGQEAGRRAAAGQEGGAA